MHSDDLLSEVLAEVTSETSLRVETEQFANAKLAEWDLTSKGWRFEWSNRKRQLGTCFYADKRIVFSNYFLHIPQSEIEDTILHEVAHALVGPGVGHGYLWKSTAMHVGATPNACKPFTSGAEPLFFLKCPNCGVIMYRHRVRWEILHRYHCKQCRINTGHKYRFEAYSIATGERVYR